MYESLICKFIAAFALALTVPRLYASFVNILVQYLINKNEVMLTTVNAKANAAYISGTNTP